MTTVYVAAEKLTTWNSDGRIAINENLVNTLISHCQNNRFVVYFAPSRFGLMLDGRDEVEDAYQYLQRVFNAAGFYPNAHILFESEASSAPFVEDLVKQNEQHAIAVMFSDAPQDNALSETLGIRKVEEIPANISNMWQKISIRRVLRTFVAAAIQTT